jgi:hypothetical protein
VTNGEIYNHKDIRKQFSTYKFSTKSDSEVIIPLYLKYGLDTPKYLDGMFSFILLDVTQNRLLVARDPIGITSLYQGKTCARNYDIIQQSIKFFLFLFFLFLFFLLFFLCRMEQQATRHFVHRLRIKVTERGVRQNNHFSPWTHL